MTPKIVRIFSRLNIGGPAIHVVLLSEKLSPKYETILVTGKVGALEGDMSYLLEEKRSFHHVFIPELGRNIRIWNDWVAFWKIFKLLLREKPAIVHTHTSKAGVLGRIASVLARVPVRIHTFHGHLFEGYFGKIKTFLMIMAERILAHFTTAIVAISEAQKRDLQKFGICPLVVIRLGFDLTPFQREKADSRQGFGLPKDRYLIGLVARLIPIKNHASFLRIAKKVLLRRKDVHFVIVGDGELKDVLKQQISELEIDSYTSLLSWHKEIKPIYDSLDIVCLTSLNEGTPVSLIEAQACGKPVVAFRVGGVEDVIVPGKSGYLVEIGDESQFSERILSLLTHPEQRAEMGDFGKKVILENFHEGRLIKEMDQLYQDVMIHSKN
jgi:glycosyltransferase involved in cell wall biosynthesis